MPPIQWKTTTRINHIFSSLNIFIIPENYRSCQKLIVEKKEQYHQLFNKYLGIILSKKMLSKSIIKKRFAHT
jgi:hypothetical protein